MIRNVFAAAAALLLLTLGACSDQPTAVEETPLTLLAAVRCAADARTETLSCESSPGVGATGAGRALLWVGGQHHYVRLSGTGTTHHAGTDVLSTRVSVQNLLLAPMGTTDGNAPHPHGLRVFFATEPTNGVRVANPSGTGKFTRSGQPYFQYSGPDLGVDGILQPDEVSAGYEWRFAMNGATSFVFTVYVQAEVPAGQDYATHLVQVRAGGVHNCGLDSAGIAFCWGSGNGGALGDGAPLTGDRGVPSAVQMPAGVTFTSIAAGVGHTCALGSNQMAYCWGWNSGGQLGNGGALNSPQRFPHEVVLPSGVTFTAIAAGHSHTCAVGSDGKGYCWGSNGFARLGNGSTVTTVQAVPAAVQMPAGVAFTSISAGYAHTCALGSNGKAYCWGSDYFGQVGDGEPLQEKQPVPSEVLLPTGVSFTSLVAGWYHNCALGSDQRAYCWGADRLGELGNGAALTARQASPSMVAMPGGVTFTSISAGAAHTCALGSNGKAYCWGSDLFGRLGNGAGLTADQESPSEVALPTGVRFTSIAVGATHSCATSSGPAYCWGTNGNRQVGDGTMISPVRPVVVAGSR